MTPALRLVETSPPAFSWAEAPLLYDAFIL